jgi:transposase
MKVLEDFCRKNEPQRKVSSLLKYADEIHKLYEDGYRAEQIQVFLKSVNIEVSNRHIWRFLKNSKNFSFKTPKKSGVEDTTGDAGTEKDTAFGYFMSKIDEK